MTDAPPSSRHQSKRLNVRGVKARRRGNHEAAMRLYRESIEADPSNPWPRYNLACEVALAGNDDGAIALLQKLKAMPHPEVPDVMAAVRNDKDFRSIRDRNAFKALFR